MAQIRQISNKKNKNPNRQIFMISFSRENPKSPEFYDKFHVKNREAVIFFCGESSPFCYFKKIPSNMVKGTFWKISQKITKEFFFEITKIFWRIWVDF